MPQKLKRFLENLFPNNKHLPSESSLTQIEKSFEENSRQLVETKFQNFIENLPVMFYAVESVAPFSPIHISSNFETFGYPIEEWKNNPAIWADVIHREDREFVIGKTERAIEAGESLDIEYRIIGKDGTVYWMRDQGGPVRNEKGEIVCFQGLLIDISAQKKSELQSNKRESFYRIISRSLPNTGIILFDHNLRYILAEGEELEKLELSSEKIEGKTIFEVFPKEVAQEWAKYYQGALAGGFINLEREVESSVFHIYILPLKNERKEIYGGMCLWQDITERKRRDQKLKESEERYRELFEGANDLVYVHDLEGNYLSMNKAAEKVFGYTPAEILKLDMRKVIAPEFLPLAAQMMEQKLKNRTKQTVYELDCIAKDGSRITLEINSSLVLKNDKPIAVQGIARDVTERKQMQAALVESEERLRNLFENANDLIYMLDLKGNFISTNKAIEKLFGYTSEELEQLHFGEVVAPEYLEFAQQSMKAKMDGANQTVYEIICLTKDGRRVLIEVNSSPMFKNGEMVAIQGIARDVTERKLAENRIQDSEAEMRALFAAMDDLIVVFDREGRYLKIPPTNSSILYKPAQELIGKTLHEVFATEKADFFVGKIREALEKRVSVSIEYSLELSGETHWFSSMISPISEDSVVTVAREITERKLSEESISESEQKYRELFENANDLIYTVDLDGNFTSLNRAGERISGYDRQDAVNLTIDQVVAPEHLEKAKKKIVEKLKGKKSSTYESEIVAKDGHRVSLEISTRLIFKDGKPVGIQGIGRDITDRKKAEKALKLSESQYRLLSEGIMHQVWTAKADGMLDYVNDRTLEYFGKSKGELLRESWMEVVHPEDLPGCLERWAQSLVSGEYYETEFRLLKNDGLYRWHRALATAGRDKSGKIIKWFGTNTDIHDQKIAEAQLNHFAKHDSLTNLPNRSKFMSHLERVVKRRDHLPEYLFAVLFLDLDRFKVVNDSLGHLVGDKLLIDFAERLESCIRPGDVVARLGGDEFTILLNNLEELDDAIRVTNRLIQRLSEPFNLGEYEVFTSASVGIVIADEVKRQPEDYLRDADTAMYRAKEAGKARYEIFNSEMHIRNMTLLQLENDLRKAIERKEFRVFYQPIISLETGEIHEFEALIRWQHPDHGLINPVEFIGVAEETGLIIPIGNWILEEACRQTAEWQKRFPDSKPFSVSVNLSSKQLMYPNFVAKVKEILAKTKLNPQILRLEVTESKVMENGEFSLSILNKLNRIGVSLSTDDFGTGYSSLSYLHRFPFDCLKIDRSFISEMDSNKKSGEIVRTILMLAQNLGLEVVAEGIETEEQLSQLQLLGCKMGQGYLFSKPVDSQTAELLLSEKLTKFSNISCFSAMKEAAQSLEIC